MTAAMRSIKRQLSMMPVLRAHMELNLKNTGRAFPDQEPGVLKVLLVILKKHKVPRTSIIEDMLELAIWPAPQEGPPT